MYFGFFSVVTTPWNPRIIRVEAKQAGRSEVGSREVVNLFGSLMVPSPECPSF
jgi:hypothetical protein